jgi:hypothetical protein
LKNWWRIFRQWEIVLRVIISIALWELSHLVREWQENLGLFNSLIFLCEKLVENFQAVGNCIEGDNFYSAMGVISSGKGVAGKFGVI